MLSTIDPTNQIHSSASIDRRVRLGRFNKIAQNVEIVVSAEDPDLIVTIGDCNVFHPNVRIVVGSGDVHIGDWNVFHNFVLILGGKGLNIGHNCWFGQNTVLDGTGKLTVGNGVRVGMYSQIWTHVASGELVEGCTLFSDKQTILEDDVWLVGSCTVSSGVTISRRSICLNGANVVTSTPPNSVFAGVPAKIKENLSFYKPISLEEKLSLVQTWVDDFIVRNLDLDCERKSEEKKLFLISNKLNQSVCFTIESQENIASNTSVFNLETKKYTKTLSILERKIFSFLYSNKARFIPI